MHCELTICINISIESQHGFFKRRSTATNLPVFMQVFAEPLGKAEQVDVYVNVSKYFDKVNKKKEYRGAS